jgi:hypothetical protein
MVFMGAHWKETVIIHISNFDSDVICQDLLLALTVSTASESFIYLENQRRYNCYIILNILFMVRLIIGFP